MSYIGNEPIVSATRTITEITATAGQTVFVANGGYTVGYIDVFVNGAQLQTSDFTATNGSSITLTEAAQSGDVIRLVAWGTFLASTALSNTNPSYSGTLTGGTGVVNIGSGQLYKDGSGNVGIGTSSPSAKLDVVGQSQSIANLGNSGAWNYAAKATGTAQGQLAGYSFYPTFQNIPGDNGPRRAADIWAGYNGGAWGSEYLAFGVADGGDEQNRTTERMRITAAGNLQFNSGYGSVATAYGCRAWVNFNGTGTVAIRASGNVSSITDNGTGDYTVNFINAMPDTNYCYTGSGLADTTGDDGNRLTLSPRRISGSVATGSIRVVIGFTQVATSTDPIQVTVAIFR